MNYNGEALEKIMIERELSITQLARKASVAPLTIRKALQGGEASIVQLSRISKALNVDYTALRQ